MTKHIFVILVLILCVSSTVSAQKIITDRPDFTESAFVVQAGIVQFESGVQYSDFKTLEELSFPITLARIGLGHNLEVRLGFSGWTNVTVNDESNSFLSDMIVEAKYQITGENAVMPMAILLVSTLPTGEDEVSVGAAKVGIKFATAYDINDRMGLGINLGAISVDAENERKIQVLTSFSLGIGLNDRLGAFVEVFAEMPQSEVWQPVLDGGFTFLLTPDAQLDLYIGKGLNDYTADLIIGAGFSFRFKQLAAFR